MIKFKTLSMRNFLSYGNSHTIIRLDRPGTTLIVGEDLDNTSNGQGANGVGKAQPLTSLLKTPNGWIKMGDVCIGDTLQTPDGSTTQVVGVFPQGIRPTYRLTFSDGRTSESDEEHIWQVQSHRWRENGKTNAVRLLTTREVKQFVDEANNMNKAWYNITIPTVVHPNIPDKKVPMDPYALGALLGDGCLSTPSIRFSTNDNILIQQLTECLSDTNGYFIKDTKNPDWRLNGTDIKSILVELSLFGCKSDTKYIPVEYLEGTSETQKLRLLQGLLDTDGTVGKTKNVSFCSVSEQLALDVQYLVRSLGGKATISKRQPFFKYKGIKQKGKQAYNVSIQYKNPHDLFTLERKLDRLSDGQTQYANSGLRIISVEQIESQECQCIMVDHPDHLYITDNFVATHNTVMINALAYGMYDKPISDISKDNLVNNINKKNMEVSVEFEINGTDYKITRYRKTKVGAMGNGAQLLQLQDVPDPDGERIWKDITPDSVGNTNKLVESIIGIPYELFCRIVVFSATHIPFLDLKVRHPTEPNQTDIIEELFDLKALSEKAELLKLQIKSTEQNQYILTTKLESLRREHDRHQVQVSNATNRVDGWVEANKEEIKDIQAKLKLLEEVDVEVQKMLHDEVTNISKQLNDWLERQRSIERNIKESVKTQKELTNELSHLEDEKCPYCLQDYALGRDKIAEIKDKLSILEKDMIQYGSNLEDVDLQVAAFTKVLKEARSKITISDLDELLNIKSKSEHYVKKLAELQQSTNPFEEPLQELLDMKLEPINMDEINIISDTIEHQKFLLKLLTKKDSFVRKVLLNKYIPFLNARLLHYLTDLGLPHTVEFTHEMTACITQFGRPMDFGNLSNGQRSRVNLAISLAFRDVLQSLHQKINVCMLDEVLDVGLDAVGVQNAARMLKRKARDEKLSLYIISHRDEIDSAFDQTMTIQMTKGFSYVKEE